MEENWDIQTENDATENDTIENDATENDTTENDATENDTTENDTTENDATENDTTEIQNHVNNDVGLRQSEGFSDYDLRGANSDGLVDNIYSKYEDHDLTNRNHVKSYEKHFRPQAPVENSFNDNRGSCNMNNSSFSEKPKATLKKTYIPPAFEDNNNLAIKVGSNFATYDKFEVKVSGMDVPKHITSFKECHLGDLLLSNLKNCNYITPTPVQKYALPIIMQGRDIIASAQTGSGKTAAFLLPIVYSLMRDPSELYVDVNHCEPQALILAPTRELAIQICEVATRLSKNTILKCGILYGGTATCHQKQKILLNSGVHILVATIGRLIDFVNQDIIKFSSLRFFVLDEADRMLEMNFQNDIEFIFNHNTMVSLAEERCTVMFSATLPDGVQKIAKSYLKPDYVFVAVGEIGGACKDVFQTVIEVATFDKKNKLVELMREIDNCQGTIVFVHQKRHADFIATYLCQMGFPATTIHGDRDQPEREKALNDFKTKKMKILVATAVAARGLDIVGVEMVVNMDLPKSIDEYVHRIGRTGRLGNHGHAVSFFDPQYDQEIAPSLVKTLKLADQQIPEILLKYSNSRNSKATNSFKDIRGKNVTQTSAIVEEESWD